MTRAYSAKQIFSPNGKGIMWTFALSSWEHTDLSLIASRLLGPGLGLNSWWESFTRTTSSPSSLLPAKAAWNSTSLRRPVKAGSQPSVLVRLSSSGRKNGYGFKPAIWWSIHYYIAATSFSHIQACYDAGRLIPIVCFRSSVSAFSLLMSCFVQRDSSCPILASPHCP